MMPFNSLLPPPPPPSIIYQAPWHVYPHYPLWIPVALLYANETGNTILNITLNRFLNNKRVGLRFNPIQNILGDIANNSFIGHENGALLIGGNQSNWIEDVYLRNVTLRILFNNFTDNLGKNFIVSLNLNELSPYQTILFIYNRLINNNITSKIQQFLNSRSRMPGVLTIGSSHIRIIRNVFGNNHSQFEIVSQLTNSTEMIRADMNFFTSIYPPPVTLTRQPLSSFERNHHLQVDI
jgi:nitrous oxidase accessory protein NosD